MQIALGAREVMNLQAFDQLFDAFRRREQRRHGDKRAQMRGNPVEQLQSRQQRRGKAEVDRAIDQRDGGVDRGNRAEHAKQAKNAGPTPAACRGRAAAPQEGLRRQGKSPSHSRRRRAIG